MCPIATPVVRRPDVRATIVEYGDHECRYCAAARPVLPALFTDGSIRLVFRNFPLAEVHIRTR